MREIKIEDIKLICIEEKESKTWCVYIEKMPGVIVQVDDLKDAPKELGKSFECLFRYGFDIDIHEIKHSNV